MRKRTLPFDGSPYSRCADKLVLASEASAQWVMLIDANDADSANNAHDGN